MKLFLQGHAYLKNCRLNDTSKFPPILRNGRFTVHVGFWEGVRGKANCGMNFTLFLDVSSIT